MGHIDNPIRGVSEVRVNGKRMRESRWDAYKEAELRDFIKKREGTIIRGEEFIEVLGLTTAQQHVRRLMKQGRIERFHIPNGQKGHSYGYKWVDLSQLVKDNDNNETHKLDSVRIPTLDKPRNSLPLCDIDKNFLAFCDVEENTAEEIAAANKFRKFVKG